MQPKEMIKGLFDFSFQTLITPSIIKAIYILAIFSAGFLTLAQVISLFIASRGMGVIALLISPLLFLFFVATARVSLEVVMAIFKIAENTGRLRAAEERRDAPPPPVAPS